MEKISNLFLKHALLLCYQYVTVENESEIFNNYWVASEILKINACITAKIGLIHISYSHLCLKLRFLKILKTK